MSNLYKKYTELDGKTIKTYMYYSLGGMNYFSGRSEPRGYYLSVGPVQVTYGPDGSISCESFTAFSGIKELLVECKRKNNKAEQQALAMIPLREPVLLKHLKDKEAAKDARA